MKRNLTFKFVIAAVLALPWACQAGTIPDFCEMKFPADRWCWSGSPDRNQDKCRATLAQGSVCNDAQTKAFTEWTTFLKATEARRNRDDVFACQVIRGCLVSHEQGCPATICTEYKDDHVVDWVAVMACAHKADRGVVENPAQVNDCIARMPSREGTE
jgi:hypothetical protein